MKKQAELDFPPMAPPSTEELADRGRKQYREVIRVAFKAAVDRMTLKEVAWLLKTGAPQIVDAIEGRDRKSVKLEWLVVLLVAAPEDVRRELVTALNRIAGFQAPEKRKPLDASDENRIMRRAIARIAPGILPLIEEEIDRS